MSIWQVVEYSLVVTIVALLLLAMKRVFHDKLDARWHYFIWMVLAVRMIVPLELEWLKSPLSLFEAIPVNYWTRLWALKSSRTGIAQAVQAILPWYLAGVVILASYYLVVAVMVRIRSIRLKDADSATCERVAVIARKYELKPCKRVKIAYKGSPYVCGLIRPILVLNMQEDSGLMFSEQTLLEQVIVHELLHKKHGDVLINYALHLVRVVNWFNPFIWYVTAVILNDSEALCDQRVLELMRVHSATKAAKAHDAMQMSESKEKSGAMETSEATEKNYGNLLIRMAEKKSMHSPGIGTTNMANSYRSMRTRIKRIADFRRVPSKVGFVALCITIILSVSSIAYCDGKNIISSGVKDEKDLNRVLLRAQLYEARTPEEAIYLYLKALKDMNPVYLMAVMPEEEIPIYEEWIINMYRSDRFIHSSDGTVVQKHWINYNWEMKEHSDFSQNPWFTQNGDRMRFCNIYGLKWEESNGTAVARITIDEPDKENDTFLWWELQLMKEDGWKVRRMKEYVGEDAYAPQPVIAASGQSGDWMVYVEGQNEASFSSIFQSNSGWQFYSNGQRSTEETQEYPKQFEMIYKMKELYVTYLGDEPLYDTTVEVILKSFTQEEYEEMADAGLPLEQFASQKNSLPELVAYGVLEARPLWQELARMSGDEAMDEAETMDEHIAGGYISSSTGAAYRRYDGSKLESGQKMLLSGGGTGYASWKETDTLHFIAWIYYNGECVEVIVQ